MVIWFLCNNLNYNDGLQLLEELNAADMEVDSETGTLYDILSLL